VTDNLGGRDEAANARAEADKKLNQRLAVLRRGTVFAILSFVVSLFDYFEHSFDLNLLVDHQIY
jgi:hypothetical protein